MKTDPFPAYLCWILNIEYSVITSEVIKSFDCIKVWGSFALLN